MARMIKRVVVVALCCGVSVASADPASEPKVKAIELSPPSLQMPQPSALNALMVPRSDHDIDMLARAIRRSDQRWRAIDVSALALSTAGLACDWGQTHSAAAAGWHKNVDGMSYYEVETNPLISGRPSVGTVNLYFAVVTAANAVLWAVAPRKYRSIVPVAVLAMQTIQIARNTARPHNTLCGF
jgi:hypothetical protein